MLVFGGVVIFWTRGYWVVLRVGSRVGSWVIEFSESSLFIFFSWGLILICFGLDFFSLAWFFFDFV